MLQSTFNDRFSVFELHFTALLHESFTFLADYKDDRIGMLCCFNRQERLRYLEGLVDSEGSLNIARVNEKDYYYFVLSVSNTNHEILQWLEDRWQINGKEALKLLRELQLRHRERMAKRSVILENVNNLKRAKQLIKNYLEDIIIKQKAGFQLFLQRLYKKHKTIQL